MTQMGVKDLESGKFAENLTTIGICLHTLPVGTRLRIGETLHEVTQIGKECHHGCAIKQTGWHVYYADRRYLYQGARGWCHRTGGLN